MEYFSVKEASALWKIDPSRVSKLARDGRIEGAKIVGRNWLIPRNAKKPTDGRTREAKKETKEEFFRFPLYVNGEEESFFPPLSREEAELRTAQLDFFACHFEKAEKEFEKLAEKTEDGYLRISALFFQCILSAVLIHKMDFDKWSHRFHLSLAKEYPYQPEMELFRPWLYIFLGLYQASAECFQLEKHYEYSPTAYPVIVLLSFYETLSQESMMASESGLHTFEIECRQLIQNGSYYEAQELHLLLFVAYCLLADEEAMKDHLREAMKIAFERNLIFPVANLAPYYEDCYTEVLKEYPKDFSEKVLKSGKLIFDSFAEFTKMYRTAELFGLLSKSDYRYVLYCVQGYSYKQVAKITHLSERTVAGRYAEIYDKLGVDGRQGLLERLAVSSIVKR